MRYISPVIICLAVLFAVQSSQAQQRWSLEVRSGPAFATEKLEAGDLDTGFGFEATVAYRFLPHLAGYAGWGWHHFSADESFAGADMDFEETGYTFGLQFIHPFGSSSLSYLLRGGAIYNHIETENQDGDIIADSGHGLGWQVEAGLTIALGERWRVIPSVRYRSLSRDIEISDLTTSMDLNYFSTGIGISWSF